MTRRIQVEQVLVWLFVVLAAMVIGGGLYELRVTAPLWANAPPESLWYWETVRAATPQYVPDSGINFWIFVTPLHMLVSLATFIMALTTRGAHRRWLLISTAIFFLMHVTAFVWFVPAIGELRNSQQLGMAPDQIAAKAHLWVRLSWVRFAIGLFGFLAGLRALSLPPSTE